MIKAVFLDVDNTLLDFHACARAAMEISLQEKGVPYTPDLFPIFRRINDELWQALERGEITKAQLYQRRWPSIFAEAGISLDGVEFEKRFILQLRSSAVKIPYALELVTYLAEKYSLYAASNAPLLQQTMRLERSGLLPYLQQIFTSEELGYPKPSRKFFDACFRRTPQIRPEEAVIIGDSLTADIKGGMQYGMKTCWFNPAYLPTSKEASPDVEVHTLLEIKNIL